jgi:hypothetical protein
MASGAQEWRLRKPDAWTRIRRYLLSDMFRAGAQFAAGLSTNTGPREHKLMRHGSHCEFNLSIWHCGFKSTITKLPLCGCRDLADWTVLVCDTHALQQRMPVSHVLHGRHAAALQRHPRWQQAVWCSHSPGCHVLWGSHCQRCGESSLRYLDSTPDFRNKVGII